MEKTTHPQLPSPSPAPLQLFTENKNFLVNLLFTPQHFLLFMKNQRSEWGS